MPLRGFRGGWQRGLEPSLHDRPSQEIWPGETDSSTIFPSKLNMTGNVDMEGR